jgi:membrane protease YdiL (CAAX protease family)
MLFFSPLLEELVYRGFIFYIVFWRVEDEILASTTTNILFAIGHLGTPLSDAIRCLIALGNLFVGKISTVYVLFQVRVLSGVKTNVASSLALHI